jgi:hypothetical protein
MRAHQIMTRSVVTVTPNDWKGNRWTGLEPERPRIVLTADSRSLASRLR